MRIPEACAAALALPLLLCSTSCVILPVRSAPGVEGRVVDQTTGEPLEGAIVLLRFDGRYDDVLPDREHLGHSEAQTGPDGRFSVDSYVRPGLTLWPHFHTEARVVGVIREGYRCPAPVPVPSSAGVRIALSPAADESDRRDSCRPVSARRGEANAYMTAWRALFPPSRSREQLEQERQLARLLEARAAFGYGENCEGPVHDLALAPGGERAAIVAQEGPEEAAVRLLTLGASGVQRSEKVSPAVDVPPRRLAWTGPDELLLWQPSRGMDRAISASIFAPGRNEVVWRGSHAPPASLARDAPSRTPAGSPRAPLDPADLNDEADTLWLGRSFALERAPHPETGLSRDRLRVTREDGSPYEIELPGEACGGPRFGRPHYRIVTGGRLGLDLRWVDDGCHAVEIDLASGDWARIDDSEALAVCRSQRRIPPAQIKTALRGWSRELEASLEAGGADPGAAFSLRISDSGETRVQGRNWAGEPISLDVPRFPLATPLRRIDVTTVAPATRGERATPGAAGMQPL